jgi:hypothetical protein
MTTFRDSDFPINRPASMIAALPAVLGFVPEHSLVLVTLECGELGCVMRVDLTEQLVESLEHLADVAAASGPDAAIAVVVDEDGASCRMCVDEHHELMTTLAEVLDARGVELLASYVVDRLEAGGRWHRPADSTAGTIEDPMSSPMAAAAVLGGRPLYGRRAELQDVIALADPERAASLRPMMEHADPDGALRSDGDVRRDVEHALAVSHRVAEGLDPTDVDLVRLGRSITDPRVRDTLYALAVGREAGRAESLWILLARTLPDPWRTEALALLAFSAYARGDGPLTGVSLEAALCSNPGHRMAAMLDQALQSGIKPDQIRDLAQTGYRLAKRLGIRLPPRLGMDRRAG